MSSNQNQQSQTQPQAQAQHQDAQPGTTASANLNTQQAQQPHHEEHETPLDYYETLNIKHSATPAAIERAYKYHSLRFHPHQYSGQDATANDTRFAHISEAYQVLSDPEKRRKYDDYLTHNKDKFREYQNKHRQENQQVQLRWRDLHPFHYRYHPYSPFMELFGYRPVDPFEHFNRFLTHGLFDDEDLDVFGFNRSRALQPYGYGHRNERNDFFGDRELRNFYRDVDRELQHHSQQPQTAQQGQTSQAQATQQPRNSQPFEMSRSVVKHTRVENGVRTTITETKKVNPDGHVEHTIKEETEDREGNRKVRFLNALPEDKRHQITQHQSRPTGTHDATQQSQTHHSQTHQTAQTAQNTQNTPNTPNKTA